MKRIVFMLLFLSAKLCMAQAGLQLEMMPGAAFYSGDLTQSSLPFRTIGPAGAVNLKYDWGDIVVLRAGVSFGRISADDKYNDPDVRTRKLNFKTNIMEGSLIAEVNLLDPETHTRFPYILAGVGIFHFNPYAYDKNNKKTFLQPLSTEGQGLPEYPDRKEYKLTQFCIPFGVGYRHDVKGKFAVGFEIALRYLFTDYLDDVSKTYIDASTLLNRKGETAVELAYRQTPPLPEGTRRGNPDIKDVYFMSGLKFTFYLSKKKKPSVEEKKEE